MFSTSRLFDQVPCPDKHQCKRAHCIYSHIPDAKQPRLPHIPISVPDPGNSQSSASNSLASSDSSRKLSIPSKRPVLPSPSKSPSKPTDVNGEPPRKLQKVTSSAKHPTATAPFQSSNGVPILRVNAAQSQVAIPVRQTMLKTLFEHFATLYSEILPNAPDLAAEHALAQEQEVYSNSTKLTYRNAVISSVAALKRRQKPTSMSHESVGTEAELQRRREQRKLLHNLRLTRKHLTPYIHSVSDLKRWGYITDIPSGRGGDAPSEEGNIKRCERCGDQFAVKRREEAAECCYHWGKPYSARINGEKVRIWKCCSRSVSEGEPCETGPHVFYESDPEQLHARHAFSLTRNASDHREQGTSDTALDVVALDCEMIYTTGGMRVARVSVVDGSGQEILDEIVKMDDGVEVIDFNTRFSGITEEVYSKALLPLASIRRSLDAYINSETIVIGHALENDLKTLRMIHHTCVDTAILFPHPAGPPYRKALRDLVREHLNEVIQSGGGSVGHSSVEDSIATLNLVRWLVVNKDKSGQGAGITSAVSVLSQ